ncbi:YfmQ family protein [Oceanobacillus jordanicus]|uniref:YfmQ family protein n=1 Tax=Oceanobacillus jordanicus TaxID=2867266 RepID=A0AAW5B572_9BACI|nr:YfmQ family protein [Oceanobacillus jordanicus]MCG3419649.1 YfmQ family protein [Oceanobacillus jordanicus]
MTWTTVLVIVGGIILKLLTSPPSALVGWLLSKFELHPKLESNDITVAINGKHLQEEEKNRFTDYFNEAHFLKSNHIFPGNEELFLHPETNVIPFIINVKIRKREMNLYVYCYDDQVDVVKQWKKKVTSYSLRSEYLQKLTSSKSINEQAASSI